MDRIIEKTLENLKKNNMAAYYAETKEDALEIVKGLLKKGETISCGGSETLKECKIRDHMDSGDYNFLDRAKTNGADEMNELYRKCFFCDTYLTSANAVTEAGELINVDGNCNRIAAILYGPKSVICVVGKNKLVADVPAGFKRVKTVAAPLNTKRLGCNTPCAKSGICIKPDGMPSEGCDSPDRICVNYVVGGKQRIKDRVKVIICNENLGY